MTSLFVLLLLLLFLLLQSVDEPDQQREMIDATLETYTGLLVGLKAAADDSAGQQSLCKHVR